MNFFLSIRSLTPVTQLYVSVDASTKESLKKIDRPLFRDYWSRFIDSLKALADKVDLQTIDCTDVYCVTRSQFKFVLTL